MDKNKTNQKTKKTEKLSFVISKNERQFLNECLAFYYGEGNPMSMSSLVKLMIFDDRNALFQDLRFATGNSSV